MLVVVYAFINDRSFPLDFVKLCCVDLCLFMGSSG